MAKDDLIMSHMISYDVICNSYVSYVSEMSPQTLSSFFVFFLSSRHVSSLRHMFQALIAYSHALEWDEAGPTSCLEYFGMVMEKRDVDND